MADDGEGDASPSPVRGTRINLWIFAGRSQQGLMPDSEIDKWLLELQQRVETMAAVAAKHAARR